MTRVCGTTLLTEALVRAALVVTLDPDGLVALSRLLQLATVTALTAWAYRYSKHHTTPTETGA